MSDSLAVLNAFFYSDIVRGRVSKSECSCPHGIAELTMLQVIGKMEVIDSGVSD